jgi:flagellar hook-associated protein 3 FlgL
MQISTYSNYAIGSFDMSNLQNSIQQLQEQLDTQQSVNTPSDNPVAATQILALNESDGRNSQFVSNTQGASSSMSLIDNAMSNVSGLLSSMKSLVVQAGSGTIDASQLQMMQQQVNQDFTQMMSYANTTDGRGDYLFGGNKVGNPPFTADSSLTTTYNGDTGQRVVQITDSSSVPVTQVGSQVFGNSTSPTALFDAMQQLSQLLGQSTKPANFSTQLQTIMSSLDSAQNQVLSVQASVGAAEQENSAIQSSNQNLGVLYQTSIDNLQQLDLPKAISQFTMAQTSLQYSQLTFSKVTQLSLFNYLQ